MLGHCKDSGVGRNALGIGTAVGHYKDSGFGHRRIALVQEHCGLCTAGTLWGRATQADEESMAS